MKKKINSLLTNLQLISTILLFLYFISCTTSEETYFPLKIKNQFLYISKNQKLIKTIIGEPISFNNFKYTPIIKIGFFQENKKDTLFYRKISKGIISEYINFNKIVLPRGIIPDSILNYFDFNSNEQIRYNFNINVGESYPIFLKISDIKVNGLNSVALAYMTMVSKNDKIQLENKIYNNCIRIDYKFATASDFNFSEWFVKGIGLVKIKFYNTNESFILKD